eukprot:TRINITY_DN1730_c0_g2_i3.p2 TRINITY_DN1730_c0_g2~~TRINITY_DN1730_c0_g2_i3.p2  ORF type:complete len:152 (-),score=40.84 TRINITY_DN1730_c0_g2_i3:645-1100(-)
MAAAAADAFKPSCAEANTPNPWMLEEVVDGSTDAMTVLLAVTCAWYETTDVVDDPIEPAVVVVDDKMVSVVEVDEIMLDGVEVLDDAVVEEDEVLEDDHEVATNEDVFVVEVVGHDEVLEETVYVDDKNDAMEENFEVGLVDGVLDVELDV